MTTPITCWTCATPYCREYHTSKDEAASCSCIEPYTAYQCPVCSKIDKDLLFVGQCCDIDYYKRQLEFAEKASERNPELVSWRVTVLRRKAELEECEQRVREASENR